jgi:hypothetical protein
VKLAIAAGVVLALSLPVAHGNQDIDPKQLRGAIDKGLGWLSKLQQADGSFKLPPGQPDTLEKGFPLGYSSLATLTLLKCGTPPDDPQIALAFRHLYSLPLRKTYSVSMLVLAIEARFAPPPAVLEKEAKRPYSSVARRRFGKRARKPDLAKLAECVKWLLGHRSKTYGGWRYPEGVVDQDNSCTQYAMLALKAARRLGSEVPAQVFEDVADFFVAQQDPVGPLVPGFSVPAADGPIYDMLPPAKRKKLIRKEQDKERKKEKARERTRTRDPERVPLVEARTFNARGWSYLPRKIESKPESGRTGPEPKRTETKQKTTGSMTSSGIIALCIAKSELERSPKSWRPRRDAVEIAIRDGCAWLAKHFRPQANPGSGGWKYYYLYSVERAGVLAGTYRFGAHDWWDEGAIHLFKVQEPAGTWPDAQGLSRLSRTCFALLFLERATVPLVPFPPKRVMTGSAKKGR